MKKVLVKQPAPSPFSDLRKRVLAKPTPLTQVSNFSPKSKNAARPITEPTTSRNRNVIKVGIIPKILEDSPVNQKELAKMPSKKSLPPKEKRALSKEKPVPVNVRKFEAATERSNSQKGKPPLVRRTVATNSRFKKQDNGINLESIPEGRNPFSASLIANVTNSLLAVTAITSPQQSRTKGLVKNTKSLNRTKMDISNHHPITPVKITKPRNASNTTREEKKGVLKKTPNKEKGNVGHDSRVKKVNIRVKTTDADHSLSKLKYPDVHESKETSSFIQTRNEPSIFNMAKATGYMATVNTPGAKSRPINFRKSKDTINKTSGSFILKPKGEDEDDMIRPSVLRNLETIPEKDKIVETKLENISENVVNNSPENIQNSPRNNGLHKNSMNNDEENPPESNDESDHIRIFGRLFDEIIGYVITQGNEVITNNHIEKPMSSSLIREKVETVGCQLKYYEERMKQIEEERLKKEKENVELKNYLERLQNDLKEKEHKIQYYNKIQIDDPRLDVVFLNLKVIKIGK